MLLLAAKPDPTDPTWLAVFGAIGVGAIVNALITALSLIYQNKRNGEREDRRRAEDATERQRDREAEANARAVERRQVLDDHWRDERRSAHVELLAALFEGHAFLIRSAADAIEPPPTDDDDPYSLGGVTMLQRPYKDRLSRLVSNVMMICSDESVEAAVRANSLLHQQNGHLHQLSGFEITEVDKSIFFSASAKTAKAIRAYRRTVRRDLGVTAGSKASGAG